MADVIPFAPRPTAARLPADPALPSRAAVILFFTGVRYERPAEADAAAPQPRRRRRLATADAPSLVAEPRPGRAKRGAASVGQPV